MTKQYFDWGHIDWIYTPDINNPYSSMNIGISTILPGKRQREHIHYGDEQLLYVLSGRGEQMIENKLSIKKPGSIFHIEAGSVHEAINKGDVPIKELLISVPVQYSSAGNIFRNYPEVTDDDFYESIKLNEKILERYREIIKSLGIPLSIFDKDNKPIIVSDSYPEFCLKTCRVDGDIKNCKPYNIRDGYGPPHYVESSAFVCPYGLKIFVEPIIVENRMVGSLKAGHVRTYEGMEEGSQFIHLDHYSDIQVLHKGRIMAVLRQLKELSRNLTYYYILEHTKIKLDEKEEIIEDIVKNELILEESLKNTKKQILSTQINNHFLFNTLNAIASLAIQEGNLKTYDAIIRLSKIFRYSLKEEDSSTTIKKEIQFIRDYLELQRLRFSDKLKVFIHVDQEAEDVKIPFKTIQPIVENCFNHGFKGIMEEKIIEIRVRLSGDNLIIDIGDNGLGLKGDVEEFNRKIRGKTSSKVSGLVMVYRQLELFFHEDFYFEIINKSKGGTLVRIILPNYKL